MVVTERMHALAEMSMTVTFYVHIGKKVSLDQVQQSVALWPMEATGLR